MSDEDKTEIECHATCDKQNQPYPFWKILILRLICWEAVLTIATIFLAYYTYGLWHSTNELLIDAKDTAKRQASEVQQSLTLTASSVWFTKDLAIAASSQSATATASLGATQRMIKITEDTAQKQLMAYIFVDSVDVTDIMKPDEVEFTLVVRNSGRTPAYKFVNLANFALVEYEASNFPSIKKPKPSDNMSISDMPPNGIYISHIKKQLTESERIQISIGTQIPYIFGEIEYVDAYHVHRKTMYRFRCGRNVGWPCNGAMYVAPEGNCADDECK